MADRVVKVRLSAEVAEYMQGMDKAAAATWRMGSEAEKLAQKRQAFDQLGKASMIAGGAMLAASVLAVKAAMDWESAWAGVTKTVDGTPEQLARVEQGLRDLTGVLPASHQEIAAVAEAAGQLGVQTDNVVAFTKTMIDLGETTNLSANDAATQLARLMNIMQSSPDDVGRLGAAIVGLGNNYATTEAEILEMAMRLAGAGKQIGMTEGDVLGLATALSSVGIEAEAGGSAMSKVMIDIASSVEKGGERLQKFATVAGMTSAQFSKLWREDSAAALSAFVKGLANAESQGSSTLGVLADLGLTEGRMRDALLRSSLAADQFTDAMAMGNREFELNNALTAEAAKRYETAESKVRIAGNAIRDAAIDFGAVLLPVVAKGSEAIADLAGWFADLPEPVQGFITIFGTAAGAILFLGGAALTTIPKLVEFKIALEVLGVKSGALIGGLKSVAAFLTGPWGVAIAAVAVGAYALNRILDDLKATQEEITNVATTANSAEKMISTAFRGMADAWVWDDGAAALESFQTRLEKLGEIQGNWWARFSAGAPEAGRLLVALEKIDVSLGQMARSGNLDVAQNAFQLLADKTDGSREQLLALLNSMPEYKKALTETATAAGVFADDEMLVAMALKQTKDPAREASAALEGVGVEADASADFLSDMQRALDDIARTALDMGDAVDKAQGSLNRMAEAAVADGASLDGTNDASIRLRDSIRGVEEAFRDAGEAILNNGGTLEQAMAQWNSGRDSVVQMRMSMGESEEAAREWADTNLGTAAEVKTALESVAAAVNVMPTQKTITITVEAAQAQAEMNAIIDKMGQIPSNWRPSGFSYNDNEAGGWWEQGVKAKAFAAGGFPSGVYPGGAEIHKFAEKSLPWEVYISPKPGHERENIGYAVEALRRLGALDGISSQPSEVSVRNEWHINGYDPSTVGQIAAQKVNRSIREVLG